MGELISHQAIARCRVYEEDSVRVTSVPWNVRYNERKDPTSASPPILFVGQSGSSGSHMAVGIPKSAHVRSSDPVHPARYFPSSGVIQGIPCYPESLAIQIQSETWRCRSQPRLPPRPRLVLAADPPNLTSISQGLLCTPLLQFLLVGYS